MVSRSAILTDAWKSYRLARPAIFAQGDETGQRCFLRALFARLLRTAWADAKKAAKLAACDPTVAAFVEAQRKSRVAIAQAITPGERSAAISRARDDLALLDYAPLAVRTAERRRDLRAQLDALTAA